MKRIAPLLFAGSLFLEAASSTSMLYAQAGLTRAGEGRQAIKIKLASIRLDVFKVENLPLGEVLNNLRAEAKRRDPEKRGLNFVLSPNFEEGAPSNQPGAVPTAQPVDIAALPIKVPSVTDISLEDALQAITAVAGPPRVKYRVEDYAVVFYPTTEAVPLVVRVFKVDPNTFQQGLHGVVGVPFGSTAGSAGNSGGGQASQGAAPVAVPQAQAAPVAQGGGGGIPGVTRTNNMVTVQASARAFLQGLGVDMTPPKSVFFNDRKGTLMVRATRADLELIEAALGH
jgi:hypothetical protein